MSALDLSPVEHRPPHPSRNDRTPSTVEILADRGALPRIVDLMAKLGLEPDTLVAVNRPDEDAIAVRLELAGDGEGAARLSQRLAGMIATRTVVVVTAAAAASG